MNVVKPMEEKYKRFWERVTTNSNLIWGCGGSEKTLQKSHVD